jgi:outer membrane protein assembly factor BamB
MSLRWKKRALGASALAIAGVVWTLWLRREQPGRVLDFQPVAAARVLVARRDIHPDVPNIYLELDDAQKGVVWRRTLPRARVFPDAWNVLPNAVATAGVYVLRTVSNVGDDRPGDRTPILQGLRADDGALLWTVAPMGDQRDASGRSFRMLDLTLLAKDDLVLSAYGQESVGDVPNSAVILALDAHTGQERWRAAVGDASTPAVGPAWIRGGALVLFAWTSFSVIDLATGKTTAIARADGLPCVTERAVWFTSGGELRELALDTLAQRPLPRPTGAPFELHGPCARRGGEIWAPSSDRAGDTSSGGHVTAFAPARLLALDAATGTLRRRVELGPVRVGSSDDDRLVQMVPDEAPLSGEASRFVPFVVRDANAPPHLVMVDLDEARIAWKTRPNERFVHARTRRQGGRQFLYESSTSLFAALDGATGHLLAAGNWPVFDKPLLAEGGAWFRDDWAVTRVDPATLLPVWSTGKLRLEDARADAEALLDALPK